MIFANKTILISGASGNLGRAISAAFATAGGNLVLLDRNVSALCDYGSKHLVRQVNLLNETELKDTIEVAVARFGHIDIVCNVAGGFAVGKSLHETTDCDWENLLSLNIRTLINVARVIVPHMLQDGGGKIINVGANSAGKGLPLMAPYCATKDMVARITESMSAELRDSNINVNAVLPSIIDTPENRKAMPDAAPDAWVTPDALADVVLFLASSAARAIHGALLPVTNRS
jgi:NAD(P)-dependent dehydrogenase (short-subunit alcohol dehydrogenase family)